MMVDDSDVPTYLTKDRVAPTIRLTAGDFFAKNAVNNIENLQDYCKRIMTGTLSTEYLEPVLGADLDVVQLLDKSKKGNPFPKTEFEDSFTCTRYTKVLHLDSYLQRLYDSKDDRQSYFETL